MHLLAFEFACRQVLVKVTFKFICSDYEICSQGLFRLGIGCVHDYHVRFSKIMFLVLMLCDCSNTRCIRASHVPHTMAQQWSQQRDCLLTQLVSNLMMLDMAVWRQQRFTDKIAPDKKAQTIRLRQNSVKIRTDRELNFDSYFKYFIFN